MKNEEFVYRRPKDTLFYQGAFVLLSAFFIFLLFILISKSLPAFDWKKTILLAFFLLSYFFIVYTIWQIIRIRKQHEYYDKNKKVVVSTDGEYIEVIINETSKVLRRNEINLVEIFESWTATYPLGYFKHMIIHLKSKEKILLTSSTLPMLPYSLSRFLKGKKTKYTIRFYNTINNFS